VATFQRFSWWGTYWGSKVSAWLALWFAIFWIWLYAEVFFLPGLDFWRNPVGGRDPLSSAALGSELLSFLIFVLLRRRSTRNRFLVESFRRVLGAKNLSDLADRLRAAFGLLQQAVASADSDVFYLKRIGSGTANSPAPYNLRQVCEILVLDFHDRAAESGSRSWDELKPKVDSVVAALSNTARAAAIRGVLTDEYAGADQYYKDRVVSPPASWFVSFLDKHPWAVTAVLAFLGAIGAIALELR